jgi:dihydropteroate synthase
MGIINLTPDSFWEGSRRPDLETALKTARAMALAGAAIIDLGGESTRPGADPVSTDEECQRVVPVISALVRETDLLVSIDTRHPLVAEAAIAVGANIVNDVGGLGDPAMLEIIARTGVGAILMHMRGQPKTMQEAPAYQDVVAEVDDFFSTRLMQAEAAGIDRERIWLDPGIGFGKRLEDNLALVSGLGRFAHHDRPLVIGVSRKSFIGTVTGSPVEDRLIGTCLYHLASLQAGASVLRVHDVSAAVQTIAVWRSLLPEREKERSKPIFYP